MPGTLLLVNSRERFLALDRKAALAHEAERTWRAAASGAAATGGGGGGEDENDDGDFTPELSRFLLIAHADLKTYKYTYWFAFPALKPPRPFLCSVSSAAAGASAVAASAAEEEPEAAAAAAQAARPLASAVGASAAEAVAAACDEYRKRERKGGNRGPPLAWTVELSAEGKATCSPLRRLWSKGEFPSSGSSPSSSVLLLAFADPGADSGHPGWTLRNALYASAVAAAAAAAAAAESRSGRGRGEGGGDGGGGEKEEEGEKRKSLFSRPLRCLGVRLRRGVVSASACLSLDVDLASADIGAAAAVASDAFSSSSSSSSSASSTVPEATGWELNARGKPGPRSVDLSAALDPAKLAADALALNLRLMRWRAAPTLDPAAVSGGKFLLLGAGTLGCCVARTLLGWGVTDITFVDSGVVSYSNPPRQSLFEHADCFGGGEKGAGGRGGGKPKAAAAAAALQRVFPGCRAKGVRLSIPMPGHPLSGGIGGEGPSNEGEDAVSRISAVVAELDALVRASDVVMLLTDTREARWLPALLCAAHAKICITAALGFDSYVVIRHGGPPREGEGREQEEGEKVEGEEGEGDDEESRRQRRQRRHRDRNRRRKRLGCYFCSDVVAPTDSTRDRALDQQCTVSRPGCAPLAGAIAAELAAAVLAHPLGVEAPPPKTGAQRQGEGEEDSEEDSVPEFDLPLGEAAHMVRGRLGAAFAQTAMVAEAFGGCTACSLRAVRAFESRGAGFVLDALRDPGSLEALTGLDELHASAAAMVDSSEEEEEEEGEREGGDGKKRKKKKKKKEKKEGGNDCDDDCDDDEWTEL